MRPGDIREGERLDAALNAFDPASLPGIQNGRARWSLVEQMVESQRRRRFVELLMARPVLESSTDPDNAGFDPLRSAIYYQRQGNLDEACWMVFLFVHFGKHRIAGYRYARAVYGRLGSGRWDWASISGDVGGFRRWLESNRERLASTGAGPRGFGNHRKYESLSGLSSAGTGAVIAGYIDWVRQEGSHGHLLSRFIETGRGIDTSVFDALYRSLTAVPRFGRTARFDYSITLTRISAINARPGKAYLAGSTGPLKGARLLFDGIVDSDSKSIALETRLRELEATVGVGFDVWEDALCNWQKSPHKFKPFRG